MVSRTIAADSLVDMQDSGACGLYDVAKRNSACALGG